MDAWLPYLKFWAPYLLSGGSALCFGVLLPAEKRLSWRSLVFFTGLYAIIGGTISPILAALSLPAIAKFGELSKAELTWGWAAAIGAHIVTRKQIGDALRRKLPGASLEGDDDKTN